jgi:sphinganine-1-phosphate aldolase
MEAEVVAMVVDMYNGTDIGACGTMTSGGTESILMAVRAHKEWAREEKGITSPHMILPVTAHAAFDKAGDYFGIRITHVPIDPVTCKVDIRKVKSAICSNTILVVGSAVGFPHGIQDDIVALSDLAIKNNIGLHVDCCLGGFIVPFMEAAGYPIPPFDFRVPGVTSISCDPHKYGYAPKGNSVVLYRTPELRRHQYFCAPNWPGGVYASPSVAGSRPGNLVVGCWAAMVHIGKSRYVEYTRKIVQKTLKMRQAVETHPELKIFGNPLGSILAFGSDKIDVYKVGNYLSEKGWDFGWLQFPSGIHISVTILIDEESFVKDLEYAMEEIRKQPFAPPTGQAKTYGAATSIPDRSIIDRIARGFIDTLYAPL